MQKYYKSETEESVGLLYVDEEKGFYDVFLVKEKLHCRQEVLNPQPYGNWKEISGDQYAENMIDYMDGAITPFIKVCKEKLIFKKREPEIKNDKI